MFFPVQTEANVTKVMCICFKIFPLLRRHLPIVWAYIIIGVHREWMTTHQTFIYDLYYAVSQEVNFPRGQ